MADFLSNGENADFNIVFRQIGSIFFSPKTLTGIEFSVNVLNILKIKAELALPTGRNRVKHFLFTFNL